ncbi:MAG: hypothetical protein KDK11_12740 [Maritimibacter sp.]|nr:hypothetical protein [Maritimibacter sp.]
MARIMWIGLWMLLAQAAAAQDWDARIEAARAKEAEIVAYGVHFGWDYNNIGTLIRHVDSLNLECSVIAEMLGLGDISGYLDFYGPDPRLPMELPPPSVTPDEITLQTLLEYAMNLGGWAYKAGLFKDRDRDGLSEYWELTCNGKLGIPEGLLPEAWETRAAFRLDGTSLTILGDIETGLYAEFAEIVANNPVDRVFVGSRGGSVLDAMKIGGLIRAREIEVGLSADCESACPLVFFAGKQPRIFDWKQGRSLGFHQVSAGGAAIPFDSEIYETIGAYVAAMGVDPEFVLAAMKSTPPDGMYFPPMATYCAAGIVDSLPSVCDEAPRVPTSGQ